MIDSVCLYLLSDVDHICKKANWPNIHRYQFVFHLKLNRAINFFFSFIRRRYILIFHFSGKFLQLLGSLLHKAQSNPFSPSIYRTTMLLANYRQICSISFALFFFLHFQYMPLFTCSCHAFVIGLIGVTWLLIGNKWARKIIRNTAENTSVE